MGAVSNFNRIAGWYDRLASVFSGGRIKKSQLHFLPILHDRKNILVLGGGTGWIIQSILSYAPGCRVVYIDASAAMIRRARKMCGADRRVTFIIGTENDIPQSEVFDAVITNFYLDLFAQRDLERMVTVVDGYLDKSAIWIATDFISARTWHQVLLKVLYQFFRITTGLQTQTLPAWESELSRRYQEKQRSKFFSGFIQSSVFYCR